MVDDIGGVVISSTKDVTEPTNKAVPRNRASKLWNSEARVILIG